MPARVTLDAFPGRHFQGRVRRIAPYVLDVEKQARTVDVEAEFVDPKETKMLLVGYSADVEIVLATHENVLRIPTQSLQEGHRVLVYRPDSQTLEQRTLEVGLSNWRYTEVVSGLKAGERVAVSLEREGVQAGARVVPQSQTAAPAP
jgi:HlyD family secretion protein